MQTFFAVAGVVILLVSAIAAAAIAVQCELERIDDRAECRWEALLSTRFARRLRQDAYWFSEDPKTQKLLEIIADQLVERGDFYTNVEDLRDQWRQFKLNERGQ